MKFHVLLLAALVLSSLPEVVQSKKKKKAAKKPKVEKVEEKDIDYPDVSSHKKKAAVLPGTYCYACQSIMRNALVVLGTSKDWRKVDKEVKASCNKMEFFLADVAEK